MENSPVVFKTEQINVADVIVYPRIVSRQEKAEIQPHYKTDPLLVLEAQRVYLSHNMSKYSAFEGLMRNHALEEHPMEIAVKKVDAKEIADINLAEMARATSQKWFCELNEMIMRMGPKVDIVTHTKQGRVSIALPGAHLGFEIGGILRFFNEQKIPVDITAIDTGPTGQEKQFIGLEKLLSKVGSTCNFMSNVDASLFLHRKKSDIVILRHPGPIFGTNGFENWKKVFEAVKKSDPAIVILSTYNHEIDNPDVLDKLNRKALNPEVVTEFDVFDRWLINICKLKPVPEDYTGMIMDNRLK